MCTLISVVKCSVCLNFLMIHLNMVIISRLRSNSRSNTKNSVVYLNFLCSHVLYSSSKGYFHLCPRMDSLQTLHINNSLDTNNENVFIELDS